jgi:hypothetical protein
MKNALHPRLFPRAVALAFSRYFGSHPGGGLSAGCAGRDAGNL